MSHSGKESKNRTVRQNSIALLFSRLTAQGLAILFVAILARRFGLETFGRFAFYAAVVLVGNTFTNFGTDTYLIREIARAGRTTSLPASAFGLQFILSAVWWLGTILFRPELELLTYSLALFPLSMISVATASLRAFERMDLIWMISLANGAVQIIAALASEDLWTLCSHLFLGQLILAGVTYWICNASLDNFRLAPPHDLLPLLRATLPFAALTLLLVLSQRLGVLSVSILLGDASTGLFSSVARIVDGLKLGHYAVLGALLPVLSRGTRAGRQTFRSGFGLLMGLTFIMATGLSLLSPLAILVVYGKGFAPASDLLALLGWSLIPYTLSSFISYDLIAREKERILVKATAVSLSFSIALYLWLICRFGLAGAVYAALAGEICQAIIFIWFAHRSGIPFPAIPARETLK